MTTPKDTPKGGESETFKGLDEILVTLERKLISDIRDAMDGRPRARTFGVDDKPIEEAKQAINEYVDSEVVAELKKYKAAYATDLSVDAYNGLEQRINKRKRMEL